MRLSWEWGLFAVEVRRMTSRTKSRCAVLMLLVREYRGIAELRIKHPKAGPGA